MYGFGSNPFVTYKVVQISTLFGHFRTPVSNCPFRHSVAMLPKILSPGVVVYFCFIQSFSLVLDISPESCGILSGAFNL